jgi:hypothetical protein
MGYIFVYTFKFEYVIMAIKMNNRSPTRIEMEHWKLVRLFYPSMVKYQPLPEYLNIVVNSKIEEIIGSFGSELMGYLGEKYAEISDEQEFYIAARAAESTAVYTRLVELSSSIKIKTTWDG